MRSDRLDVTSAVLVVVGLATSIYLTFEHYTGNATLVCAEGGAVDCSAVTTSQYSSLFGVPVALLGLLYFVASLVLLLVSLRRPGRLATVQTAWYGVGLVFVGYLVWAELVPLGKICLWCTVVHVVVLVLFLVSLARSLTAEPARS